MSTDTPINHLVEMIPIIVLNWNGEDDTLECLRSIKQSVPAGFLPVVVDNGSSLVSLERLKQGCDEIFGRVVYLRETDLRCHSESQRDQIKASLSDDSLVFIENCANFGFAKGSNVGIRFAEIIGSEWVMLLNNDTIVARNAFQELRRFVTAHPAYLAITPQIRHYSPATRIQNCGGTLTYFGSQKYRFWNEDVSALPQADFSVVTFITGCALLFNYKVAGPLTEDFFFGEEDYEFSLRMKKLGLGMACVHRAVVHHKLGASISKTSKPLGAILVYYENRLINTRNYYSELRWQTTKLLAYLYLPVLFVKRGIALKNAIWAIKRVECYIRKHKTVPQAEFQSLVVYNR